MKAAQILFATVATLLFAGCGAATNQTTEAKSDPTFMFWCFRKEIVKADYHIPEMKTAEAAQAIQNRLKAVIGYVDSSCDLSKNTLSVRYKSSTIRSMNIEEAIALAGYKVNNRPAQGAK